MWSHSKFETTTTFFVNWISVSERIWMWLGFLCCFMSYCVLDGCRDLLPSRTGLRGEFLGVPAGLLVHKPGVARPYKHVEVAKHLDKWRRTRKISNKRKHLKWRMTIYKAKVVVGIPTDLLWTCDRENTEKTTLSEEIQRVIAQSLMTAGQTALCFRLCLCHLA